MQYISITIYNIAQHLFGNEQYNDIYIDYNSTIRVIIEFR